MATGMGQISRDEADRVRRRARLLVEITSRVGAYRTGLKLAARRLSRSEAAIIADLEAHGLDVNQLRDVLWGAHVLVDDPDLYERWRFPKSRERLSSHHKDVDKATYPDLGLKGALVREKLHGRTALGTWVQLEKTPAAIGNGFRLPTVNDFLHLCDYIVYRITKSNVGPWGLSKQTERRPVYLSPALSASVPVHPAAEAELTAALQRVEDEDEAPAAAASAGSDLVARFPAPDRSDTMAELVFHPHSRNGRGLFGASAVYTRTHACASRAQIDRARTEKASWSLPEAGDTRPATVRGGDREIRCAVRRIPATDQLENL